VRRTFAATNIIAVIHRAHLLIREKVRVFTHVSLATFKLVVLF
jgi:hypothetical protein